MLIFVVLLSVLLSAKAPEDVYKTHLEERGRNPATSVRPTRM